jgi:LemA protein
MPLIALLIVVAIIVITAFIYNSLIRSRNRVDEAWSDIEVQLKRRYDLIPNLVNTVKGYAAQESNVLQKVTEARTAAMGAQTVAEHQKDENQLSGALTS